MPGLLPNVDPDGLLEYSVVYTDRSLNHMSQRFQGAMRDLAGVLKRAYGAAELAIVPGSGTFGMEAVARQFASGKHVLVVRNGLFSFRWTQIFEMGNIPASHTVCKARPVSEAPQGAFAPAPIDEVVATIALEKPAVVFAPHVETASGMLLPDDYLRRLADAVHAVGGLFVLDCIASGALWVDMRELGVDVLVSAPQKGWSSTPCCAFVLLGERALQALEGTISTSFACDLKRWLNIMRAYEQGNHAYHATMPTDGLLALRDTVVEAERIGFARLREHQLELGRKVRALLAECGYPSVAAAGFEAPGVVVSYTTSDDLKSGKAFAAVGLQTAAGVPLQCDEPASFKTFRIGLFGLDKLGNIDRTVSLLRAALDRLAA